MTARFACIACLGLSACIAQDASHRAITLRDPLGLIEDVYASGNAVELFVLPADAYTCTTSTGEIMPPLPEAGQVADATVEIRLSRDELAQREVTVPIGSYTVFARGKGTDRVSGETNTMIVRACAAADITAGATVGVTLTLVPVLGMGVCGNGVLSADEQCETTIAECGPDCRTTREPLNTTTPLAQSRVRVARASGQRVLAVWDSDASSVGVRLFDPNARGLVGLGPLGSDYALDELSRPEGLPGVQTTATAAVAQDGRVAIAFVDFALGSPQIRVGFFSDTLARSGAYQTPHSSSPSDRANPSLAFHASGSLLVVYEDASSSTGLSGRMFGADGSLSGSEPLPVGAGQTGGKTPVVTAAPDGFVVVFAAASGAFYQRLGIDGSARDPSARPVDDDATPRVNPTVAALADGSFLVAWAESGSPSDPMGMGIRGRVFAANGEPQSTAFQVNEMTEGDQNYPSVAASDDRFIIGFESGTTVRARVFSSGGEPLLNRERPPTLGEFEVAPAGARPSAAAIGQGADRAWWIAFEAPGEATDIFARRYLL